MPYELRPLSLAELLDRSFGLYRRHFLLFAGILALPSLVMLVISVGLQFLEAPPSVSPGAPPDPSQMLGAVVWGFAVFAVLMILYWFTYAVALGASTAAVSEIYRGKTPTIAESYGAMRGKVGRLAWLLFQVFVRIVVVMLLVMAVAGFFLGLLSVFSPVLGALAFVVAFCLGGLGVCWVALRYAVAVPPAVLEDSTALESIARSVELTRGSLWRVVVLFVFAVVIGYAGLMLTQGPFFVAAIAAGPETTTGFWLNLCGVITGSIASILTGPLAVVAMAVLYYDLRIRKEGLDLEIMIADLRGEPSLPAPPEGGRGLFISG